MSWRDSLLRVAQEIRIQFAPQASTSQAIKKFVSNEYIGLKSKNPTIPILIRESPHIAPRITVRYDYGIEKSIDLSGVDSAGIEQKLSELAKFGETTRKSDESIGQEKLKA